MGTVNLSGYFWQFLCGFHIIDIDIWNYIILTNIKKYIVMLILFTSSSISHFLFSAALRCDDKWETEKDTLPADGTHISYYLFTLHIPDAYSTFNGNTAV